MSGAGFREPLAVALAQGLKVREAAKQVGCSEAHAYTLSREPETRARVRELRDQVAQEIMGKISEPAVDAIATTVSIMQNVAEDSKVRLTASKTIMEWLFKFSEQYELRERLQQLEQASESIIETGAEDSSAGDSGNGRT